jgi:dihydrofolate synthase/folylpolyglutamate synthase
MPIAPAVILQNRRPGRIRPELDGLREVLGELGNPQSAYPSILIVGTNGKGSTAVMLEAILRAHGLTTGLFTSPHLIRVEERVRLNGVAATQRELSRALTPLDAFPDLTYFETVTAAALTLFAEARVDVAVLEAGMGGSWDATRLAGSAVAGLTNVGTDHRNWLGASRAEIARDKGRALQAAERAIIGSDVSEDLRDALGAPDAVAAQAIVSCEDIGDGMVRLGWDGVHTSLPVPFPGGFQHGNLQLAVALALQAVAMGWLAALDPDTLRECLRGLYWPGRLSRHLVSGREVLVDCAHNLEAARALAEHLAGLDSRYNLLFSCLSDKPVDTMAALLRPHVGEVAVCQLEDERAMPLDSLIEAFPGAIAAASPREGLEALRDPVVAAGSLRLAGALLALSQEVDT